VVGKVRDNTRMKSSSVPMSPSLTNVPAAPRARRFASMMYEGVLLFGVVFLADYLFDTLTQSKHALMLRHTRQIWLFIAIGLYFIACWIRSGQTLPMKAWNIRLIGKDGKQPRMPQLLLRYTLMWVLPLCGALLVWGLSLLTHWPSTLMFIVLAPFTIFIPTWFTPEQQFLHDLLSRTRLVNTGKNP
jgi:uncharacterized RDD family membrane protein YckC